MAPKSSNIPVIKSAFKESRDAMSRMQRLAESYTVSPTSESKLRNMQGLLQHTERRILRETKARETLRDTTQEYGKARDKMLEARRKVNAADQPTPPSPKALEDGDGSDDDDSGYGGPDPDTDSFDNDIEVRDSRKKLAKKREESAGASASASSIPANTPTLKRQVPLEDVD